MDALVSLHGVTRFCHVRLSNRVDSNRRGAFFLLPQAISGNFRESSKEEGEAEGEGTGRRRSVPSARENPQEIFRKFRGGSGGEPGRACQRRVFEPESLGWGGGT